jgi:hypothetical protein
VGEVNEPAISYLPVRRLGFHLFPSTKLTFMSVDQFLKLFLFSLCTDVTFDEARERRVMSVHRLQYFLLDFFIFCVRGVRVGVGFASVW